MKMLDDATRYILSVVREKEKSIDNFRHSNLLKLGVKIATGLPPPPKLQAHDSLCNWSLAKNTVFLHLQSL